MAYTVANVTLLDIIKFAVAKINIWMDPHVVISVWASSVYQALLFPPVLLFNVVLFLTLFNIFRM